MAIVLAVSEGRIDLTVFPFVVPDFPAVFVVVAATGIDVQPAGASTRTTDGEAHFAASITPGTFPVMDTVDVVAIGPQNDVSFVEACPTGGRTGNDILDIQAATADLSAEAHIANRVDMVVVTANRFNRAFDMDVS